MIERKAPAKINVWLEILGERPDGYHDLQTVMQTVAFADILRFTKSDDGRITLTCDHSELKCGPSNLVVQAAEALKERSGVRAGAEIELIKNIPIGAGLGGGSSDCATTLMALAELWKLDIDDGLLHEIAAELGSDIPFFLYGGTCLCEGRGERVTPLDVDTEFDYVLILPEASVSTAEVYKAWEPALTNMKGEITICTVQRALQSGDRHLLGEVLHNDLQKTAFQVSPEIRHVARVIESVFPQPGCLGYSLSGSGAAFFAVCEGAAEAASLAFSLQSSGLPAVPVHSGITA